MLTSRGAVFSRVVLHSTARMSNFASMRGERHCIQMAAHNSSLGQASFQRKSCQPLLAPPVRFRYRLTGQPDQRAPLAAESGAMRQIGQTCCPNDGTFAQFKTGGKRFCRGSDTKNRTCRKKTIGNCRKAAPKMRGAPRWSAPFADRTVKKSYSRCDLMNHRFLSRSRENAVRMSAVSASPASSVASMSSRTWLASLPKRSAKAARWSGTFLMSVG